MTGAYNLPESGNESAGIHRCLESLFQHTPPTALFQAEARLLFTAQQHLARLGKHAPRDVSLLANMIAMPPLWPTPAHRRLRLRLQPSEAARMLIALAFKHPVVLQEAMVS